MRAARARVPSNWRGRWLLPTFIKGALVSLICALSIAAESNACLGCHTKQASQPATAMANALDPPAVHPILNAHPKLNWEDGPYKYAVDSANGLNTYTVSRGTEKITVPVRWAFGAHSQTWVLEYQGKLYESHVSFYQATGSLDLTMGHERHPGTMVEAMGREISNQEAVRCFQCHSTGAVKNDQLQLDTLRPGLKCDHCHSGTAEHFKAISNGKLTSLPPKLKQLTAEDISSFCGQCHRSFSDVVRDRSFGDINVRFQPYRLARSKCFNGSDARISCIACHDPHQPLVRSDVTYEDKCLACHGASASNRPVAAKVCATGAATGCVGCHMPKTELPGAHLTFTDHYIRIVRAGEKYPE